jgi:hypothetical protein
MKFRFVFAVFVSEKYQDILVCEQGNIPVDGR